MNHCHKRAEFLYRDGKFRIFWCSVCDIFIKIADGGKRREYRNNAEGAAAVLGAMT